MTSPAVEQLWAIYLAGFELDARPSGAVAEIGSAPVVIVGTDELRHDAGNLYTASLRITVSTGAEPGEIGLELRTAHAATVEAVRQALELTTENGETFAARGQEAAIGTGGWWQSTARNLQGADRWETEFEVICGLTEAGTGDTWTPAENPPNQPWVLGTFRAGVNLSGSRLVHVGPDGELLYADSVEGREAHGFIVAACMAGASVTVLREGRMPYEHNHLGDSGWLGTEGRVEFIPEIDGRALVQLVGAALWAGAVSVELEESTQVTTE
jgi:hypothetical protein